MKYLVLYLKRWLHDIYNPASPLQKRNRPWSKRNPISWAIKRVQDNKSIACTASSENNRCHISLAFVKCHAWSVRMNDLAIVSWNIQIQFSAQGFTNLIILVVSFNFPLAFVYLTPTCLFDRSRQWRIHDLGDLEALCRTLCIFWWWLPHFEYKTANTLISLECFMNSWSKRIGPAVTLSTASLFGTRVRRWHFLIWNNRHKFSYNISWMARIQVMIRDSLQISTVWMMDIQALHVGHWPKSNFH
jgi:hypothetical protein